MRIKIFVLGLACLLMLGCVLSAGKKKEINPWQEFFTEPVEKIHVIMKDKVIFRFISHYENMVHLNVAKVEKELKKHSYKIKDIEIVIHNHFADCKFSPADQKQYRALRRHGFRGQFLLYCHRTNKTYCLEDKRP